MRIQRKFLNKAWAMLCALALLLSMSSAALASPAAPANGGLIGGHVSSPGGYPLPDGTRVKLFDADGLTTRGQAVPDANNGSFQFGPVANGQYILKAAPPAASSYTQSLPEVITVANAPASTGELALTEPQVQGSVFAPDGVTPYAAEVAARLVDGRVIQRVSALSGQYKMGGLPAGSYELLADPTGDEPYWRSPTSTLTVMEGGALQTTNLTLTDAQVWGYAQDSLGNPLRLAKVFAYNEYGERASNTSNASGFWAIGGLPGGNYQLSALPPYKKGGLLPPTPVDFSLPGATNPYTLTFEAAAKQVQGSVSTNTGLPVDQALVVARRMSAPGSVEALSAADGSYLLGLAPGLWSLTVRHTPDISLAAWVYPESPQLVYFAPTLEAESRTQDFTVLTADAQVAGMVQMPDSSLPPFTVTVSLYSSEGVGRQATVNAADGSFSLQLPNGSYKVAVHAADDGYLGPLVNPVSLPANGSLDLGTLTLLPRDALISGVITVTGAAAAGIPVVAWRPGAPGNLHTTSSPDGTYSLAVSAGDWYVRPAPTADQPYLYTGPGQQVQISSGQVLEGIDFELLAADAAIQGSLLTEAGQPAVDAQGWAGAWQTSAAVQNGALVENGQFTIYVPAGDYHLAVYLPPGGPYLSTAERQVNAIAGETTQITLTVQSHNAQIQGSLWDPRNNNVVEGVSGQVNAWTPGAWLAAPINTDNGTYRLAASDSLWRLNFRIDPDSGYTKIAGPMNIPLSAGQTATAPLRILQKDSQLSGSVLAPDGSPLEGATVIVKGESPAISNLWLQITSQADGSFELAVPYGRYRLGAAANQPDWIKPLERQVVVLPGSVSPGHVLQFRLPDVTISGTITIPGATSDGMVHVWAWEAGGGFVNRRFPVTSDGTQAMGTYQIGVLSNTTWNLGATYETESQSWAGRAHVAVGSSDVTQDLTLDGPHDKPAPVVVTFDASQAQHLRIADGTYIYIPAGAMPVSGTVTLRVAPIATLPHQRHANILRYGYAFLATDQNGAPVEASFNQDVMISFTYDDADLLRWRIVEALIKPAYYSTTTQRWTFPESYVVDTENNRVMIEIDHFTDYALTSVEAETIFLPMLSN